MVMCNVSTRVHLLACFVLIEEVDCLLAMEIVLWM
jgi:hypothetical protein